MRFRHAPGASRLQFIGVLDQPQDGVYQHDGRLVADAVDERGKSLSQFVCASGVTTSRGVTGGTSLINALVATYV